MSDRLTTAVTRTALALAGLALTAGSLVACGGKDDASSASSASSSASVKEFCGVFNSLVEKVLSGSVKTTGDDFVTALKAYADDLSDVGTPKGMSDDARAGFELTVSAIKGLPDDAGMDELTNLGKTFSGDSAKKAAAFQSYVTDTCPAPDLGLSSDLPSGLPTDFSTDLPTDLPTDFPSNLPTELPTELSSLFPSGIPTSPSELASYLDQLTASPG